jgi:hypothetical protein
MKHVLLFRDVMRAYLSNVFHDHVFQHAREVFIEQVLEKLPFALRSHGSTNVVASTEECLYDVGGNKPGRAGNENLGRRWHSRHLRVCQLGWGGTENLLCGPYI